MFSYDNQQLGSVIKEIIQRNLKPEAYLWIDNAILAIKNKSDVTNFNIAFVVAPRKTGKEIVVISEAEEIQLQAIRPGLTIKGWSLDRLCRVYLLMHLDPKNQSSYVAVIENLFLNAEMNEQVALYSSLSILAYPEAWRKRCSEGIRSNIGIVLESIMCNNPYPAEQLDEQAWNQLVLKAIFTEKPLLKIYKLRERANKNLADAISAFAHERWAARRTVNPLIWYCVIDFLDEKLLTDIERLAHSQDMAERKAATLICSESNHKPARDLLTANPDLAIIVKNENLSWEKLDPLLY